MLPPAGCPGPGGLKLAPAAIPSGGCTCWLRRQCHLPLRAIPNPQPAALHAPGEQGAGLVRFWDALGCTEGCSPCCASPFLGPGPCWASRCSTWRSSLISATPGGTSTQGAAPPSALPAPASSLEQTCGPTWRVRGWPAPRQRLTNTTGGGCRVVGATQGPQGHQRARACISKGLQRCMQSMLPLLPVAHASGGRPRILLALPA